MLEILLFFVSSLVINAPFPLQHPSARTKCRGGGLERRQIVGEKTVDGKRARNSAAYRTRWHGNEAACTGPFRMQEIEPISRHTYVIGRLPITGIFVDREQSADNSDLTTRRRDVVRARLWRVTHGIPVWPKKGRKKGGEKRGEKKEAKWTACTERRRSSRLLLIRANWMPS